MGGSIYPRAQAYRAFWEEFIKPIGNNQGGSN